MREREAAGNPPPRAGCGWRLADGDSAGLVSSLEWCVCECVCVCPPLTWQAVKCASLWCAEAVDCIHAHRSRQPLIHWMTSHKRDKPVQAVVSALRYDMNRLFSAWLCISSSSSVYYSHAAGYLLLSAGSCAVFGQASIQKEGSSWADNICNTSFNNGSVFEHGHS